MQNVSRILVGIILIPIVITLIFFLPRAFFVFFMMVLTAGGLYEYFNLVKTDIVYSYGKIMFSAMGAMFPLSAFFWGSQGLFASLFVVLAVLMGLAMGRLTSFERSFSQVGGLFIGFFFIATPLSMAVLILSPSMAGREIALWMVLVIWAGDTGAFYLGTTFGRHKLYPKISPKKSVEGVVGGIVLSLLVGYLSSFFLKTGLSLKELVFLPFVLILLGQWGDFSESMLKRGANVKDSGRILGGHGGILDRIDSFLFTIPFFYYYLLLRC